MARRQQRRRAGTPLYPVRPMSELAERMQLAVRIVREVGAHAITYYQQQDIGLDFKPDRSPVTRADKEGEELARRILDAECPADAILGEEFGEKHGSSGYRWYLDPYRRHRCHSSAASRSSAAWPDSNTTASPSPARSAFRPSARSSTPRQGRARGGRTASARRQAALDPRPAHVSSDRRPRRSHCSAATGFHDFARIGKAEGLARLLGAVSPGRAAGPIATATTSSRRAGWT